MRMIVDADGWQRKSFVVTVDPIAIVVTGARESDHLPRGHVLVAAVNRVGEKAVLRVPEDELEKILSARVRELERAVLEALDGLVLLIVREIHETLAAVFAAAGDVERGECRPVLLCWRDRRL